VYDLNIKPEADKTFRKLARKNRKQLEIINNKVLEIRSNLEHVYKFLTEPLQTFNRIHIDRNFVLIFKVSHSEKAVDVYYYDHHDNVYKWRPPSEA